MSSDNYVFFSDALEKKIREILIEKFPEEKEDIEDYIGEVEAFGDYDFYNEAEPDKIIKDYSMGKNTMIKIVVILSGGMDSTTLLYDVVDQGYDAYALTFDYGQKHKIEIKMAKKTCEKLNIPHKIIDLSALNELAPSALTRDGWDIPEGHYEDENMKQTVVPNRNMVLLSLAVAYAIGIKAEKVFYGAHTGDHNIYFDCRPEFVETMKKAIKLCDWKEIMLEAPYLNIDKRDIAIKGKELNVDYSLTRTCYTNNELACGKCGSCIERLEAFEKAGIKDPIEYE